MISPSKMTVYVNLIIYGDVTKNVIVVMLLQYAQMSSSLGC